MTIQTKLHMTAMLEVFELVLIGSAIGLIADTIWLVYEMMNAGVTVVRIGILCGLVSASILTLIGCIKHHKATYINLIHQTMLGKLKIQKCKSRHKRR